MKMLTLTFYLKVTFVFLLYHIEKVIHYLLAFRCPHGYKSTVGVFCLFFYC